jgi:hypothetical protein
MLQGQYALVTAAITPLAPHMWFEFCHMQHCKMLPPCIKRLKWPLHNFVVRKYCVNGQRYGVGHSINMELKKQGI